MFKQDRQGARTPADVERKFRKLPQSVEAAQKAASAANTSAERASATAEEAKKNLANAIKRDEYDLIVSMLNQATNIITRLVVQSGGFEVDEQGNLKAQNIQLGEKDLGTWLSEIEGRLGGEENIFQVNGGTKNIGDKWQIMIASKRYLYTFRSITGGLELSEESDGIYLTATSAGVATVTLAANDGSRVDVWTFNIVGG